MTSNVLAAKVTHCEIFICVIVNGLRKDKTKSKATELPGVWARCTPNVATAADWYSRSHSFAEMQELVGATKKPPITAQFFVALMDSVLPRNISLKSSCYVHHRDLWNQGQRC